MSFTKLFGLMIALGYALITGAACLLPYSVDFFVRFFSQ